MNGDYDRNIDREDLYGSGGMYDRGPIFQIKKLPIELSTAFGMYMRGDMLVKIGKSLMSGNGIRLTARLTGASKTTVSKLYKILLAIRYKQGKEDILCQCGQPIIHQGWCSYRFKNSPKRQQFMKKWHNKNKNI